MVNSKENDNRDQINKQITAFHSEIPVLMDPTQVVARSLHITRTAEVVLLEPRTWNVIYRGPVDDATGGYGAERIAAKNPYLKMALNAMLEGNPAQIPAPGRTLGCLIHVDRSAPSYAADVVPILQNKCVYCHDARQGTWKMDGYSTIKSWAPMIRETVMTQIMPPWWPDVSAQHSVGSEGLTVGEQKTLFAWIENGAPRGEGPDRLLKRRSQRQWSGTPDIVLQALEPVPIPANGILEFQYMKLGPDIDHDLWIRGIEKSAGQGASFHHAIAFLVPPGISMEKFAEDLKNVDGYRQSRFLTNISAPVRGQLLEPPFAYFVPKGFSIVLEAHLRTIGRPVNFKPSFGVYLAHSEKNRKLRKILHFGAAQSRFEIPPGDANFKVRAESPIFTKAIDIVGVLPHMHLRGKDMKFFASFPGGVSSEFFSLPNFNANWQRRYQFAHPVHLPAGSRIVVSGAFDNSPENPLNPDASKTVHFGDSQITEEMFLGNVYYAEAEGTPSATLAQKLK